MVLPTATISKNPTPLSHGPDVGFDKIQKQYSQYLGRNGIQFNLMVCGASGIGKSTFINTLLKSNYAARKSRGTTSDDLHQMDEQEGNKMGKVKADDSVSSLEKPEKTTYISTIKHTFIENDFKVKLSITDCPGFGDRVDNTNAWMPIIDYIFQQYSEYLKEESAIQRARHISDERVHCILYFISPSGYSLKEIDILAMKHLGKVCNIIPVIAMGDCYTKNEILALKERIREEIVFHKIQVYPDALLNFPELLDDFSEEEVDSLKTVKSQIPFTVVGSDRFAEGKLTRSVPAGIVEIENPAHCDFVKLREVLTRSLTMSLINSTHDAYYENYRFEVVNADRFDKINISKLE